MYYANEYVGVSGSGHNRSAVGCVELRKWPSLSSLIVTAFAISFPKSRFSSNRFILIAVQQDATRTVYFLFCSFTLDVSGVNHTHHQEYTKL